MYLIFVILFHERRCNDCYKSKLPEVKFKIEMNLNAEEIQKLIDILQGVNNQRHNHLLRELQIIKSRLELYDKLNPKPSATAMSTAKNGKKSSSRSL